MHLVLHVEVCYGHCTILKKNLNYFSIINILKTILNLVRSVKKEEEAKFRIRPRRSKKQKKQKNNTQQIDFFFLKKKKMVAVRKTAKFRLPPRRRNRTPAAENRQFSASTNLG